MAQDSVVRARIDEKTKKQAARIFARHGLTLSDGIRIMLALTVKTDGIPISMHIPNRKTLKAMRDAESGKTTRVGSIEELFKQLNA